jgi:CBS domain containing-hemolysin-like protein
VGGWVLQEIGRLPVAGDKFDFRHLHVTVLSVEERRVTEIEIIADPLEEEEEKTEE